MNDSRTLSRSTNPRSSFGRRVGDAAMLVTSDRLLVVTKPLRRLLDVPIEEVRRIQFDIERRRPATLVIVPEHASDEPQVLTVHHDYYADVASALALVGQRIAEMPCARRARHDIDRLRALQRGARAGDLVDHAVLAEDTASSSP